MIGVEIADAGSRAVAIDAEGRVLSRASADGPPASSAPAALERLGQPIGSPIAIASPFDHPSPIVAATIAAIGSTLVIPVGVAAATAEAWIGAAKGVDDVAFFAVGDHATAGVTLGGVPLSGRRNRAASVAWLALNPVEREDYRRTGCLEAEVAAAGIVRRLVWRIKAGDRSRVQDRAGDDLGAITLDHVLDAARGGDGVSISVMRDTAKYLGMAAANLVAIVDPEVLVLGGIMATAADLLLDPVRTEVARRLPGAMMAALTIAPAALGADAAAIGAARFASAPSGGA